MSTLLTKFVYGLETDPKKTPFGLLNNQVRADYIIQNAGWFNIDGHRLGSGDLSIIDMYKVAKFIPPSEAFFALTEMDSGWNIPSHLDRAAPGFQYVIQHATWVMVKTSIGGIVVRVRDDISKSEVGIKDGQKYNRVPRSELYKAFSLDPAGVALSASEPKPIPKKTQPTMAAAPQKTTKPNPFIGSKKMSAAPINTSSTTTMPPTTKQSKPILKIPGSALPKQLSTPNAQNPGKLIGHKKLIVKKVNTP